MDRNTLKLIHFVSLQTTFDLMNLIAENGTIHVYELWKIYNRINYKNVRYRILLLIKMGLVKDLGFKISENNKQIREIKLTSIGIKMLNMFKKLDQ